MSHELKQVQRDEAFVCFAPNMHHLSVPRARLRPRDLSSEPNGNECARVWGRWGKLMLRNRSTGARAPVFIFMATRGMFLRRFGLKCARGDGGGGASHRCMRQPFQPQRSARHPRRCARHQRQQCRCAQSHMRHTQGWSNWARSTRQRGATRTARGGAEHLGLTHTETRRGMGWTT